MDQFQRVILWYGLDDWVPLLSVVGAAQEHTALTEADKARALDAIRELASAGLIKIGEVSKTDGFVPWHTDLDTSLSRIRALLNSPDENEWGFGCWLSNTADGDKFAEQWRGNPPFPAVPRSPRAWSARPGAAMLGI